MSKLFLQKSPSMFIFWMSSAVAACKTRISESMLGGRVAECASWRTFCLSPPQFALCSVRRFTHWFTQTGKKRVNRTTSVQMKDASALLQTLDFLFVGVAGIPPMLLSLIQSMPKIGLKCCSNRYFAFCIHKDE